MGMAAGQPPPGFDMPARRPFFETLVQLIIGLLFISISATVTPASLRHVLLPTLVLVAFLVLVVRPLVAVRRHRGHRPDPGERAFVGLDGAARHRRRLHRLDLLRHPRRRLGLARRLRRSSATFLVIVATVTLYGLTAAPRGPAARRRRAGPHPAAAGGRRLRGRSPWAAALRSAGLDVLMWAGLEEQRERIRDAGLELAPGELLGDGHRPRAPAGGNHRRLPAHR